MSSGLLHNTQINLHDNGFTLIILFSVVFMAHGVGKVGKPLLGRNTSLVENDSQWHFICMLCMLYCGLQYRVDWQ